MRKALMMMMTYKMKPFLIFFEELQFYERNKNYSINFPVLGLLLVASINNKFKSPVTIALKQPDDHHPIKAAVTEGIQ